MAWRGSPAPGSGGSDGSTPFPNGTSTTHGGAPPLPGVALYGHDGATAYLGGTEALPEGVATYAGAPPATSTSIHGEKNESMTYGTHVSFSAMISLDSVF